jgi:hypothetical protein
MPGRVFTAWLPEELIERFQALAADEGIPTNRWVRNALDNASTFDVAPSDDDGRD